ncbi:hypothetical protein SCP_0601400 [Sparassis crispa]|uniref:BTB domain-containing protein n=1 Tax=Sparassis crispa TaxID=139825 RepID=A0A401GPN6_9APHY|nr:hypothetical protein SCP_0601400 [Sparassis crispa]GBE84162.1 hypothetical protein SCP_0601400 [Sparassis crispa]
MSSEAPFPFNQPSADVVLRTSDDVDFHLHKLILSQASPYYSHMFTLRQPPGNDDEPVRVPETSQILDKALRIIYPVPDPPLAALGDVAALLEVATKYDFDAITAYCAKALLDPELIRKDPFGVYAVAYDFKLEEEIRIVAKETLRYPYDPSAQPSKALITIPATAYIWLMQYRERCKEAAVAVISQMKEPDYEFDDLDYRCPVCDGTRAHVWRSLIFYVDAEGYISHATEVLNDTPSATAFLEDTELGSTVFVRNKPQCQACLPGIRDSMRNLQVVLAKDIDCAISEQELQIAFEPAH